MKKTLSLLLAVIMLVSAWGCLPSRVITANISSDSDDPVVTDDLGDNIAVGGSARWEFLSPLDPIFYGVDTFIADIVGREKVITWIEQFKSPSKSAGRDMIELTIVNAVKELGVSKSDFVRANKGITYTSEQIEAIYSRDEVKINRAFVNRYALLYKDKIYTADWLASRSARDYQSEGISEEVLLDYLSRIDIQEFREEVLAIRGAMHKGRRFGFQSGERTLSRTQALAPYSPEYYGLHDLTGYGLEKDRVSEWCDRFIIKLGKGKRDTSACTVLNLVNELGIPKQLFVEVNSEAGTIFPPTQIDALFSGDRTSIDKAFINRYALLVGDKIYPAEWFYGRDISDYKKAGITAEILRKYADSIKGVDVLQREHEWVVSAVAKMQ